MLPKIKALLVMARERRLPLLEILESCGVEVLGVFDCNEARRILETSQQLQVVLTDTGLPDGDWRRVIAIVAHGSANTEVIVCSRLGGHKLWLDVLEEGGYDVLGEPYQHDEVQRIVEAASARSPLNRSRRNISGSPASRPLRKATSGPRPSAPGSL